MRDLILLLIMAGLLPFILARPTTGVLVWSWLGYMKHGEPQERVMGLKMPPPNLKPDFEEQAQAFVDGLVDTVLRPSEVRQGVAAEPANAP